MQKVHTHYDNLKIPRTASAAEIRAAYRSLCQRYHPDKNPDDPKAVKAFQFISKAYETLSDRSLKARHDLWICRQERPQRPAYNSTTKPASKTADKPRSSKPKTAQKNTQTTTTPPSITAYKFALSLMFIALLASLYSGHRHQTAYATAAACSPNSFLQQRRLMASGPTNKPANNASGKTVSIIQDPLSRSEHWIRENIF